MSTWEYEEVPLLTSPVLPKLVQFQFDLWLFEFGFEICFGVGCLAWVGLKHCLLQMCFCKWLPLGGPSLSCKVWSLSKYPPCKAHPHMRWGFVLQSPFIPNLLDHKENLGCGWCTQTHSTVPTRCADTCSRSLGFFSCLESTWNFHFLEWSRLWPMLWAHSKTW